MRQIAVLVTFVLLCVTGCKQLTPVIWPTTVKCLTAPSGALVEKVRVIVQEDGLNDVFSPKAVSALEDVARAYGPEAVVCVLKELIGAFTAPTGVEAPPDRLAAARRAQHFLNEQEIRVEVQE